MLEEFFITSEDTTSLSMSTMTQLSIGGQHQVIAAVLNTTAFPHRTAKYLTTDSGIHATKIGHYGGEKKMLFIKTNKPRYCILSNKYTETHFLRSPRHGVVHLSIEATH